MTPKSSFNFRHLVIRVLITLLTGGTLPYKWRQFTGGVIKNSIPIFATQFPSLDYSHGRILLFWFAEEYIRTKVSRHTNDGYELFSHVHTSKCVVTFVFRYAAASYYNSN